MVSDASWHKTNDLYIVALLAAEDCFVHSFTINGLIKNYQLIFDLTTLEFHFFMKQFQFAVYSQSFIHSKTSHKVLRELYIKYKIYIEEKMIEINFNETFSPSFI